VKKELNFFFISRRKLRKTDKNRPHRVKNCCRQEKRRFFQTLLRMDRSTLNLWFLSIENFFVFAEKVCKLQKENLLKKPQVKFFILCKSHKNIQNAFFIILRKFAAIFLLEFSSIWNFSKKNSLLNSSFVFEVSLKGDQILLALRWKGFFCFFNLVKFTGLEKKFWKLNPFQNMKNSSWSGFSSLKKLEGGILVFLAISFQRKFLKKTGEIKIWERQFFCWGNMKENNNNSKIIFILWSKYF